MQRNLFSTTFLVGAALFAVSAPAQATDIFTPSNSYQGDNTAAPHSWTGLWLGAVGGYQFSNSQFDSAFRAIDDEDGDVGGIGSSFDGKGAEGLFGEVQLGFDKQIGQRTVVGVFGGYNLSDAEHSQSFSWDSPDDSGSANLLSFEQEWGGVLGARVGVLKSQDTMFYVAGGWAFGEMGELKSDFAEGGDAFPNQETDLSGWFGEIGMESRVRELGDNVYFTVAGRYTDYSAITLDSNSDVGGCRSDTCSYNLELDHDTLAVMVGLKAKLGGF